MRKNFAHACESRGFRTSQHAIESHQPGFDGLGLMILAVATVLVTDRWVKRSEPRGEYLPTVGEDVSAAVTAIPQIGEEVFAPFAALNADPGVELTACEVASVRCAERQKSGLSMGITVPLDRFLELEVENCAVGY